MAGKLWNVWVGGEFFGTVLARNKTAVVLKVASILSTEIYPERLLVKPQ